MAREEGHREGGVRLRAWKRKVDRRGREGVDWWFSSCFYGSRVAL